MAILACLVVISGSLWPLALAPFAHRGTAVSLGFGVLGILP
jgi:hypothetical protein